LADKIKDIARELFSYYGYNLKEKVKYRDILQKIGETMREICKDNFNHRNVWIDYVNNKIDKCSTEYNGVVISDGRYINEAVAFTRMGYLPILIKCPKDIVQTRVIKRDGSFDAEAYLHKSETDIHTLAKIVPVCIDNSNTLENVFEKLDYIINNFTEYREMHTKTWGKYLKSLEGAV